MLLRLGTTEFRLLGRWDAIRTRGASPYTDRGSARSFVERLLFSTDNERAVRRLLQERGRLSLASAGTGAGGDGTDLAERLVGLLGSGEVRIEEVPRVVLSSSQMRPPVDASRPVAPVKDTAWVEFVVIDDATGDPVPKVKLGITLPQEKKADHTTPGSGSVDFDPCQPGSCALETEIAGAGLGSTLELVGFGEPSRTPARGKPFPNTEGRPFQIARVERHRVRRGETLESLAEGAGMSEEDLARFNFGTASPAGIDKALWGQVGCRHKTADRKNYVFSASDDPGIIYIPRRLDERGLGTGLTHQILVRRLLQPVRPFLFSH